MAEIEPPSMAMSASNGSAPVPSATEPLRMMRSWAMREVPFLLSSGSLLDADRLAYSLPAATAASRDQ